MLNTIVKYILFFGLLFLGGGQYLLANSAQNGSKEQSTTIDQLGDETTISKWGAVQGEKSKLELTETEDELESEKLFKPLGKKKGLGYFSLNFSARLFGHSPSFVRNILPVYNYEETTNSSYLLLQVFRI